MTVPGILFDPVLPADIPPWFEKLTHYRWSIQGVEYSVAIWGDKDSQTNQGSLASLMIDDRYESFGGCHISQPQLIALLVEKFRRYGVAFKAPVVEAMGEIAKSPDPAIRNTIKATVNAVV